MASVFKRAGKYVVQWLDENGGRRTETAPTKEDANALKAKVESRAFLGRHGIVTQDQLCYADAARKPLRQHLDEWRQSLLNKGSGSVHVERYHRVAMEVLIDGCGWENLRELECLEAERYIAKQKQAKRWRAASCNHATKALRGFGNFLADHDRLPKNPFKRLKIRRVEDDRAFIRGELTADEWERIVRAAESGKRSYGMSGSDRAMLYRVRMATAFRGKALRLLTPASFVLEGNRPCILIGAEGDKDKRRRVKPISSALVAVLRPWLADKPKDAPVFDLPAECNVVRMWRKDLAAAGVPEPNAMGERRDFYASRHTSIRRVRRAAGEKAAQLHGGHANPQMTLTVYDGLDDSDTEKALAALPVVAPVGGAARALQSPGKSCPRVSRSVRRGNGRLSTQTVMNPIENPAHGGVTGMGRAGVEPATHGFSVHCSTN